MGTIIEAKAVISAEDKTGAAFASIEKKLASLGKGAKVSSEVDRLTKSITEAEKQLASLDKVAKAASSFDAAKGKYQQAGAALREATKAIADAEKPTKQLASALKQAEQAYDRARASFQKQRSAMSDAASGLGKLGSSTSSIVAEQNRLKAAIDGTTAAIARQLATENRAAARRANRREALGTVAGGAGVLAATRGKDLGKKAIVSAAEFDIVVRKQRAFTDVSEADQVPLIEQSKKVGQETPYSNTDVVKAQTKAMQGMPAGFTPALKAQVAHGIIDSVKNYALVMEADLETSSEAIKNYLLQTGKDISSKSKALSEANKATNQLVKMAKLGGMSDDDVQQFMKFAGSPGSAAGLSSDTLMSLAALARRGGLRGDEAGVFIRSTSSKLVSPTRQGLAALNAAGINFSDYVSMPKQLETSRLEGQFQRDLGVGFKPKVKAKLDKILSDPKLIGDRGAFTTAVTEAVAEQFPATKKTGKMAAADRQKIAKSAGQFHKMSAQSVDTERLLDDSMSKGMTLPQLNAWLTDKHGGKGAITQRQWDEFKTSREEIRKSGDDPDFTKKKAELIMGGLGGSLENLKGSTENLITAFGTANAAILKFSFDGIGKGFDWISGLSDSGKQAATAIGLLAGAGTSLYGGWKILSALFGNSGLAGSAAALTGAAASLEAAAVKLAGGSLAGPGAAAVGGAATATVGSAIAAGATVGGVVAGGAALATAATNIVASDPESYLGYIDEWGLGAHIIQATKPKELPEWADASGGLGERGRSGRGSPSLYDQRPDPGTYERAYRSAVEFGRDPEGARGREMLRSNSVERERLSSSPVEATVKPDQITAKVTEPVKVDPVKLEGAATVTVRVEGPGQVTNTTSSGHIRAQTGGSVGTSMAQATGNPGGM